jgi:hypothetical protein
MYGDFTIDAKKSMDKNASRLLLAFQEYKRFLGNWHAKCISQNNLKKNSSVRRKYKCSGN